jgi:hypothetical protein
MTVMRMIRPLDFTDYTMIPEHTQGALHRYVEQGLEPGGFLTSVLTNDLMGAISRADSDNIRVLKDICTFIYNNVPSNAWGNSDKVHAWIDASLFKRNI